MVRPDVFTTRGLPEYHDDLLLMKLQPEGERQESFQAAVRGEWQEQANAAPAVAAVATMQQAGLISRVIPLSTRTPRARQAQDVALTPLEALADAADASRDDPSAGITALQLTPGTDSESVIAALRVDPSAQYVARVPVRYLLSSGTTPTQPVAAPGPLWNLQKISWAQARARPKFKEAVDITVAVLDSGIDAGHPDLGPRVVDYRYTWGDLPIVASAEDVIGHGTHVAGTIAAMIGNGIGIDGICECRLLAWKIFDDVPDFLGVDRGFGYFVHPLMYRRALTEALAEGVDVMNLSIGGPGIPDPTELSLFQALIARGSVVVAAMGNDRTAAGSPISYPANIPGVIAVGASSFDDSLADFSNAGNHISLVAPGVGIWSTVPTYPGQGQFTIAWGPGGPTPGAPIPRPLNYASFDGTSMASPHVAGAAALLLGNKGVDSPANVRTQLMSSASKVPAMALPFDIGFGAGRLDLAKLLA
jgi:subtilisin family serine protease